MLLDRIVCSIQDQRTHRRLLAEPELTLKKGFEVAQAIESADTQVQKLQHPRTAALHAVGPQLRPFRAQVPQSAPVNNRSATSTHRDPSLTLIRRAFRRPPFIHCSPLRSAPLRSDVPLCSQGPHARDADKCIGYRHARSTGGSRIEEGVGHTKSKWRKAKINDIHDLLNERLLRRLSSCSRKSGFSSFSSCI